MSKPAELQSAFDKALKQVQRAIASGMEASDGSSALAHLERLERELRAQRASSLERGSLDREWFQNTIRWVIEWIPDDELTLVAALGQIVRAAPPE